jgi:predicted amidohydrolase
LDDELAINWSCNSDSKNFLLAREFAMALAAAIQLTSTPDITSNLAQAKGLLQQAAHAGAMLAVLPEMFPLMGVDEVTKISHQESYGSGLIQDFLAEQAYENRIWIVGGTIPIATKDKKRIRAACIVYNDAGRAVARYDKMHLFDVAVVKGSEEYRESLSTEPGEDLIVVETPIGKLGLAVCYDLRFPELFRKLLHRGAEIIAVPSAFTVKTGQAHWEILTRSRAIENLCYAIYACQTGEHVTGRLTYGHSMIVDPWGKILHQIEDGIGFITAEIDLKFLYALREDFPAILHRRL